MPQLNDIRARMRSVQQTRKITNAMYLISSSRMRRAMRSIEQNRAYFYRAYATMREIRAQTNLTHPYLTHRVGEDANKTAFVVIAGERGLSGSYNHDVLHLAEESMAVHRPVHVFAVGDMAASYFGRRGYCPNEDFVHIGGTPSVHLVRRLTGRVMRLYNQKEIDELRVVYTRFISTVKQRPTDMELLPIELGGMGITDAVIAGKDNVLYDPSPEEVFHEMVPQFIIGYLYGALVQAYASENVARMTAMEKATDSADDMLKKLTHQYHTARQLAITNELSEIVGAAGAFGGKEGGI